MGKNERGEIENIFTVLFSGAARGVRTCWMMLALWLTYFFSLMSMVQGGVVLFDDFP